MVVFRNFATKYFFRNNKRTGVDKKVTVGRQRGTCFFMGLLGEAVLSSFQTVEWQILKRHLHSVSGDIKDLACVPSKTIVEQRGRQVKPGRRDEGETTNKSWRSPNIDKIGINNIEPSVTYNLQLQRFQHVVSSDCSSCFDAIYLSCLIYHISIENLQSPFSQFQGAVVPNNQLKIFLYLLGYQVLGGR